jgi:hypothetical protein
MDDYFSKPTTAQQISVPLSIFPMNVNFYFRLLAPFMDETSRSAFARTRKSVYKDFEQIYAEITAAVLYDPADKLYCYIVSIKELQLRNDCLRLKFFPISKPQNNNCPVNILCSKTCSEFNILNESDCARVNALIIHLDGWELPCFPFEKFQNLRSWTFESVLDFFLLGDKLCKASKKRLEYISNYFCNTANGPLKIVENCAILQENPSLNCKLSDATPIKPSHYKRYTIGSHEVPKHPETRCGKLNLIPSSLRGLDNLEINCHLNRGLDCFGDLLTNLRMLTQHYEHIHGWQNTGLSLKFFGIVELKSIMVLRIIDPNPNDKLRFRLTEGEGIVWVELIGQGYSKSAHTHKIQLDPRKSILEYVPLDQ